MWGVLLFYKQNHAIVCSHPLGSCFTAPSEAHQNRARLPIMSYRTKHKPIGIKKALVNYFFTACTIHTALHTSKGGEVLTMMTLT